MRIKEREADAQGSTQRGSP